VKPGQFQVGPGTERSLRLLALAGSHKSRDYSLIPKQLLALSLVDSGLPVIQRFATDSHKRIFGVLIPAALGRDAWGVSSGVGKVMRSSGSRHLGHPRSTD